MFVPDSKVIDKQLIDAIEHIFFITSAEKLPLNILVPMLKMEFKKNYEPIYYNKKIRNIHYYIKFKHKSISYFIKNFTGFNLEESKTDSLIYINAKYIEI